MKIHEITDQMRNDIYGALICESCGYIQKMQAGYDDYHWHHSVLPAIKCKNCDKSRNELFHKQA